MLILRRILQVIFSLLFVAVLAMLVKNPNPDYANNLPMLVLFVVIVVVLGPLWPSPEKQKNFKFDLPTDNPKLAIPLFMGAMGLASFYFALDTWLSPSQSHIKYSKIVYSLFGNDGVVVFWVLAGVACLVWAFRAYKKHKTA